MRLFNIVFLLLISINSLFAGDPPRKPFVVLKVNGQTYNNGGEITVRPGERIKAEAVLMGGRRDYCSNPQKYANVGKSTVVERSGENEMSFNINGGQFTGEWSLTQEEAIFSSAEALKITPVEGQQLKREAMIEIPEAGFSKIYLKVQSKTSWHYSRHTPAGKKEKDETNDGTATFYLVLQSEEGVWYSSNNIMAKGLENFTVRNELNEAQKFYGLIEKYLLKKDYNNADVQIQNLKNYIAEAKRAIDEAKQENSEYNCEITFIGLPTDLSMEHLNKIQTLSNKWKERYLISQINAERINSMLAIPRKYPIL